MGEAVVPGESQNVVPSNFLALHVVELVLVVQAGERLNFVMDFGEHDEEASGVLLVIWATFGKVATNIFVDTGIVVVGGCKLSNLDDHTVTEGFDVCVWKLLGQEVAKEVKLGLMSIHGAGAFLLKKMEETVHKSVVVFRPWI